MKKLSDLVTVVCVTWNNYDYFKLMYHMLKNKSDDNSIKLLVHINEDLDGKTREFCEQEKITYTYSDTNQGIFWPLNNLVNLVETEYVLFWADDILFLHSWDKYLLKALLFYREYVKDGVWISPRLIEPVNCFFPDKHPYCTIHNFGLNIKEFLTKYSEEELKKLRESEIRKLPNGNMIMSVKAFKELGGYDLNYKAGADSDLTWRFVKKYGAGGIKQVGSSLCYHFGSVVTSRDSTKRQEFEKQGVELFYKNHGFFIDDITKRILENNI